MEDILNEILDKELAKFNLEKEQLNQEISQLSGRIEKNEDGKYDMTREEKEYRKELEGIEQEIAYLEKTKKRSSKWHEDRNDIQSEQDLLLKNKEQLEIAIKALEGKFQIEDGKLVKPKELLEYENDLKTVSEKITKNQRKLNKLNKNITKLYEKYNVKEKREKDDYDKAWEEAIKENEQRDIERANNEIKEIEEIANEAINRIKLLYGEESLKDFSSQKNSILNKMIASIDKNKKILIDYKTKESLDKKISEEKYKKAIENFDPNRYISNYINNWINAKDNLGKQGDMKKWIDISESIIKELGNVENLSNENRRKIENLVETIKQVVIDMQSNSMHNENSSSSQINTEQYNNNVPKDFGKYKIVPQEPAFLVEKKDNFQERIEEFTQDPQILFDMAKGKYTYISPDGEEYIESMFNGENEERLNDEDKSNIIDEIMEKGVNLNVAKKVDPYIYDILDYYNHDLREQYIEALKNPTKGMKDLKIIYDLRTKENGKKKEQEVKYSFVQKHKINKIAKYHEKKRLAGIFRTKIKTRFYVALAAIGIGTIGSGIYQLSDSNDKRRQIETEMQDNEKYNSSPITILNKEQVETEKQTEVQKQSETGTKKQTEAQKQSETETGKQTVRGNKVETEGQMDIRIGTYVTVRTGAHLYDDPFDAVKEQLQKATNGKIVVKTKNADRVYQVTKEGLYCPDGRCIEISNGDLEAAMKQARMDINILKNIDTETLEKQGYKRMLHVVADGIAQWVEEGDSLQLQVDKFGNRTEKTETEKQTEPKVNSSQQINNKDVLKNEDMIEIK